MLGRRPEPKALMWVTRLLVISFSLLTTPTSFANDHQNNPSFYNPPPPWHTIISVGGGAAISSTIGSSQTFPIINPITDEFFIYTANHSTQMSGALDGFIGAEWALMANWALQMGLGYDQTWGFHQNGSLNQGADNCSSNQYSYDYDITTRQLLIESKLLYLYKERYHPYFLLGLGAAFNEAKDFNTNIPPFLTFTRQYKNNTQTSFSYAVGMGVDVDILEHLRLGAGYRFADLGQVSLGNATIDTTSVSGKLSQNHLYTSEILAQITYVA